MMRQSNREQLLNSANIAKLFQTAEKSKPALPAQTAEYLKVNEQLESQAVRRNVGQLGGDNPFCDAKSGKSGRSNVSGSNQSSNAANRHLFNLGQIGQKRHFLSNSSALHGRSRPMFNAKSMTQKSAKPEIDLLQTKSYHQIKISEKSNEAATDNDQITASEKNKKTAKQGNQVQKKAKKDIFLENQLNIEPWYQIINSQKPGDQTKNKAKNADPASDSDISLETDFETQNKQDFLIQSLSRNMDQNTKQLKDQKYQNCLKLIEEFNSFLKDRQNLGNPKFDSSKILRAMIKLSKQYHLLEPKEQYLMKQIAFEVLSMNNVQTATHGSLQYLNQVCVSILQIDIKYQLNQDKVETDGKVQILTQTLTQLIDYQVESLQRINQHIAKPDQPSNQSAHDFLAQQNLYHVEYKQMSHFTFVILTLIQNCSMFNSVHQDVDQAYEFDFDSIAKLCQNVISYLCKCAFLKEKSSSIQEECQTLLQIMIIDLCTLLDDQVDGAPLELPVFTLFLKGTTLQLIQYLCENIDHSNKTAASAADKAEKASEPQELCLQLPQKIFILDLVQQIMISIYKLKRQMATTVNKNNLKCFCNTETPPSCATVIKCDDCKVVFHKKCVNVNDDHDKYQCLNCFMKTNSSHQKLCEMTFYNLIQFFSQYQSCYQDFVPAQSFTFLHQISYYQSSSLGEDADFVKLAKEEYQEFLKERKSSMLGHGDTQEKGSWSNMRGLSIHSNYVRAMLSHMTIKTELNDLFNAAKSILLCMSHSKQATLRYNTIKTIKKLIKVNPHEMLQDEQIQKIIQLRIEDISSMTREMTLDVIQKNLANLMRIHNDQEQKNQCFDLQTYIDMVIQRAQFDTNLSVRRKVIQILSQLLDQNMSKTAESGKNDLKHKIIKILIKKWEDSSCQIRNSLVISIQKIIKQQNKAKTIKQNKQFSILFDIVEQNIEENQLLNTKNQNKDNDILNEVFYEVLECEKMYKAIKKSKGLKEANALILLFGNDIVQQAIANVYGCFQAQSGEVSTKSGEILTNLTMIRVIGSFYPKALRESIKNLIEITESIGKGPKNNYIEQELCKIFQCVYSFPQSQKDEEIDLDWLSPKNAKKILDFATNVMTNSPLVNLEASIKLLNKISACHCDFKIMIQPLSKCMVFIESILQKPEKLSQSANLQVISRSILLTCLIVHECEFIEKIEEILKCDFKSKLSQSLKKLIQYHEIHQYILDIALEGLSYIWIKYPQQILDDTEKTENADIFEIVFQKFKGFSIQNDTKAGILNTFTCFLENYSSKFINKKNASTAQTPDQEQKMLKNLENKLKLFVDFIDDPDLELRYQACRLYEKLFLSGMVPTKDAVRSFIKMQADGNSKIVNLSSYELQKISKNRLHIIQQVLMSNKEIFEQIYAYQQQIRFTEVSGFQRIFQFQTIKVGAKKKDQELQRTMIELESDQGILEYVELNLIKNEDPKMFQQIIMNQLKYATDEQIIDNPKFLDDLHQSWNFLRFYGESLFSLCKGFSSVNVASTRSKESQIFQAIENYILTNEILIYSKLKALDQGISEKSGQPSRAEQRTLSSSLILYILKLCHKQLQRVAKKKTERSLVQHLNKYAQDSKCNLANLFLSLPPATDTNPESMKQFVGELRLSLRALIREKDDSLKEKFKKQMDRSRQIVEDHVGLKDLENVDTQKQGKNKKRKRYSDPVPKGGQSWPLETNDETAESNQSGAKNRGRKRFKLNDAQSEQLPAKKQRKNRSAAPSQPDDI